MRPMEQHAIAFNIKADLVFAKKPAKQPQKKTN